MRGRMKLKQLLESFHYTLADVKRLWTEINQVCFDGELTEPKIFIEPDLSHLVDEETMKRIQQKHGNADIMGFCDEDPESHDIVLLFLDDMADGQELMQVVAHEMVHQALAEKHGYEQMKRLGHGPEFMAYAEQIKKYHNANLLGASYD